VDKVKQVLEGVGPMDFKQAGSFPQETRKYSVLFQKTKNPTGGMPRKTERRGKHKVTITGPI